MRRKFNLSIEDSLAEAMQIQALKERRDVSTITEELFRQYLDRQKPKGKAGQSKARLESEFKKAAKGEA